MAKSTKKSTRKFEKNKLKDTLEKRKATAKIKQRQQTKAKRNARNADLAAKKDDSNLDIPTPQGNDPIVDMSVDDFFQNGFDIPEKDTRVKKRNSAGMQIVKKVLSESDSSNESSFGASSREASHVSSSEDGNDTEEYNISNKNPISSLAEIDPDFYKYMKENDPEALDFDENLDLDDIDGSSATDEEQPRKKQKKSTDDDNLDKEKFSSDVTEDMVRKWTTAMTEQHSLRAMRQVVLAFRAAAHVDEETSKHKYSLSSPEIYHDLVLTALKNIPLVLQHHLPIKELASGKTKISTDSKKFKSLTPLLKSYLMSLSHLLYTFSDASTINLTLSCITLLIPYIISFKKLLKKTIKTIVDIWSDSSNTQATKITAFLALRRLAVLGDPGIRETLLKTVYQGLIKNCRSTTIHTIQDINLMKNSATELWGLDAFVGYTTGFMFIRQLAIHLRKSIVNNQKESFKTIYNWQYIHSLDFWSCVVSEHCSPIKEATAGKESELRPLIYPIVQITLGAMRLIPTAIYFPLRFHLIRSLLRLSRATGTYIPLASSLLEVLNSNEMKKPPKASTLKPVDFEFSYKAQKAYLHTRVFQDNVGEQVVELFAEFFALWCTNIAFPELALPVIIMLKRWLRDMTKKPNNKNVKVSSMITLFVQKLEANATWIQDKRSKIDFAPNNRASVDKFLSDYDWQKTPLGIFVAVQRKQREEKIRISQKARQQEVKNKSADRENKSTSNEAEWSDDNSSISDTA